MSKIARDFADAVFPTLINSEYVTLSSLNNPLTELQVQCVHVTISTPIFHTLTWTIQFGI